MFWSEMWRAVTHALHEVVRDHPASGSIAGPQAEAAMFVALLEDGGFTIMPLEVRRSCDLWGTVTVTKVADGYAIVDPRNVRIEL